MTENYIDFRETLDDKTRDQFDRAIALLYTGIDIKNSGVTLDGSKCNAILLALAHQKGLEEAFDGLLSEWKSAGDGIVTRSDRKWSCPHKRSLRAQVTCVEFVLEDSSSRCQSINPQGNCSNELIRALWLQLDEPSNIEKIPFKLGDKVDYHSIVGGDIHCPIRRMLLKKARKNERSR